MKDNNATYQDGFAGDRRYFKEFLAQIELIFMHFPDRLEDDPTKDVYIISILYRKVMNWAESLIESRDPCLNNYKEFISRLKATFGNSADTFVANQKFRIIRQKRLGNVGNYILEFNRYADESYWNESLSSILHLGTQISQDCL